MPKILPDTAPMCWPKPQGCSRAAVAAARNRGATFHDRIWLDALYICGPLSACHVDRSSILWRVPSPHQEFTAVSTLSVESSSAKGGVIWFGDGDGVRNAIAGSSSHHRPRQNCVSWRSQPRKLEPLGPAPGHFPQVKNCSILRDEFRLYYVECVTITLWRCSLRMNGWWNAFEILCLIFSIFLTVTGDGRVREWRIGIQWGLP